MKLLFSVRLSSLFLKYVICLLVQYPYLARLHDIADEPVCLKPFSFDFEEQIKGMIYQETLTLNPEYAKSLEHLIKT